MTLGEKPRKYLFTFDIESKAYSLLLKNSKEIKLGMKIGDFDSLFPKSFLKRTVYEAPDPRKGKASIIVFIGLKQGNDIIYAAEWFIFTFSNLDGILERITLFVPG